MKKRYILKNRKKFYSIIIALSIMLTTVLVTANVYGSEGTDYKTVTVQRGDTLWTIAGKYRENQDIRRFIYEIKKANDMTESIIYEGENLKIPV